MMDELTGLADTIFRVLNVQALSSHEHVEILKWNHPSIKPIFWLHRDQVNFFLPSSLTGDIQYLVYRRTGKTRKGGLRKYKYKGVLQNVGSPPICLKKSSKSVAWMS